MTHTPFVSNPCPATAIVFVSQNLFYGQLPQVRSFLCNYSSSRRFRRSSARPVSDVTAVTP